MLSAYNILGIVLVLIGVLVSFLIEDYYYRQDVLTVDHYGSEKGFSAFILIAGFGVYLLQI